jgi:hypothetical protein
MTAGTPAGELTKVTIRGLTMTCWKCHQPTTVVIGLHFASAVDGNLVTCSDERALATAAELLRSTGNVGLVRPIKGRTSRTTGATGLTNGCQHCDALPGNFLHLPRGTHGGAVRQRRRRPGQPHRRRPAHRTVATPTPTLGHR